MMDKNPAEQRTNNERREIQRKAWERERLIKREALLTALASGELNAAQTLEAVKLLDKL